MGGGTFDTGAYRAFAATVSTKSTAEIYTSRDIAPTLNPLYYG